jgi:hypothetical protein
MKAVVIIYKDLKAEDKLIRFSHQSQDLTKVCTYVHIFYNGNFMEDKLFFLEQQDIVNNILDLAIPKEIRSVKIEVKTANEDFDLERLSVEIINFF